jgi:hypothetical protein
VRLRLKDLEPYFQLGLKQAATELGICPSTLKRACRCGCVAGASRHVCCIAECAAAPTVPYMCIFAGKCILLPLCRRNGILRWPRRQMHPKEQEQDTPDSANEAAQKAAHESVVAAHGEALRVSWTRQCLAPGLSRSCPLPDGPADWSSSSAAAAVMTAGAALAASTSMGWEPLSTYLVSSQLGQTALANPYQQWSLATSAVAASAAALHGRGMPTPTALWGLPVRGRLLPAPALNVWSVSRLPRC